MVGAIIRDKKNLPVGLAEKQELQRQQTINKVLRAVDDIINEGKKVSISALMEYTGLSRSTFAKPHIRELLVEYGYATGGDVQSKLRTKTKKQADDVADKDRQIAELRIKNAELETECELLRGRLFLMMQNMREGM